MLKGLVRFVLRTLASTFSSMVTKILSVIAGFIALLLTDAAATDREPEHSETRLLSHLFGSGYDARARPYGSTTVVHLRINMKQIAAVSEAAQTVALLTTLYQIWSDTRLMWNASQHEGTEKLSIPYSNIWTPDTTLYNAAEVDRGVVESKGNLLIQMRNTTTSSITFTYPAKHMVGCRFDIKYFPFDDQICTFTFGSWNYDTSELDYELDRDEVTREQFQVSDEWDVLSFGIEKELVKYACCKYPYAVLTATLVISRKPFYYIFNLIVPTLVINVIATFSLFSSPGNAANRHDKVQIGITALLTYCILLQTVSSEIPKGSPSIPLLSWFYICVMIQNAVKMYVAVFISYPERRRYLTKAILVKCLRMKRLKADRNAVAYAEGDPTLETMCCILSIIVTVFITATIFGVAYSR